MHPNKTYVLSIGFANRLVGGPDGPDGYRTYQGDGIPSVAGNQHQTLHSLERSNFGKIGANLPR